MHKISLMLLSLLDQLKYTPSSTRYTSLENYRHHNAIIASGFGLNCNVCLDRHQERGAFATRLLRSITKATDSPLNY